MINFIQGDILQSEAEVIINTVNTKGIMGKGLALQFKQKYPEMFTAYAKACKANHIVTGKIHIYNTNQLINPKYIINFPTKNDWKENSKIEDIISGLRDLNTFIIANKIKSIAVPPLGCGNGGLPWPLVKNILFEAFIGLPSVNITIYEPSDQKFNLAIDPTKKPRLTPINASILDLLFQFPALGYENTLLTTQKLCYFLQTAGQNLQLKFIKNIYGPYADNLRQLIKRLDGYYITGLYDSSNSSPHTVIEIIPEQYNEIKQFLSENKKTTNLVALERVKKLIYGFESPYGLELLSTVHWSVVQDQISNNDIDSIISNIKNWNKRKAKLMSESHIRIAHTKLVEEKWI